MSNGAHSEAGFSGKLRITCKYGENGYQVPAALYSVGSDDPLGLDKFKLVAGTDPSYNNLCDLDRLLQSATHLAAAFELNRGRVPHLAIGVKHGNPCGAAINFDDPVEAARSMITGDQLAIFGGLVITSFPVTAEVAEALVTHGMEAGQKRILDGIVAPSFEDEAVGFFERKGAKCRLLANPALGAMGRESLDRAERFRYVRGGFLLQPNYSFVLDFNHPEIEKHGAASEGQENDMLLAKCLGDTSNSNTVTICKQGMLIGNGVGQQARVRGAMLAKNTVALCGHDSTGGVASSDSFFPFTDGVEVLAEAGIKAIISTSGSVKDKEVIRFCEERGIVLYLIPDKVGRGFFGH